MEQNVRTSWHFLEYLNRKIIYILDRGKSRVDTTISLTSYSVLFVTLANYQQIADPLLHVSQVVRALFRLDMMWMNNNLRTLEFSLYIWIFHDVWFLPIFLVSLSLKLRIKKKICFRARIVHEERGKFMLLMGHVFRWFLRSSLQYSLLLRFQFNDDIYWCWSRSCRPLFKALYERHDSKGFMLNSLESNGTQNFIRLIQSDKLERCIVNRGLQRELVYLGWPMAPSYMSPNAGGGGKFFGVSANEYSCAHGAQINFGDLTPYLTDDRKWRNYRINFLVVLDLI